MVTENTTKTRLRMDLPHGKRERAQAGQKIIEKIEIQTGTKRFSGDLSSRRRANRSTTTKNTDIEIKRKQTEKITFQAFLRPRANYKHPSRQPG